ncbi:MAG: hypothetical protein O3A80_03085 [bacterium]|nr:hypothetical protein [bacterium]
MSPNGPEQAGVDAEQRRIDSLDRAEDRRIDVGQKDRTPEQLGEIYLKKTNDLQGKIRDLQRQADVLRDKRDPAWQALENSCTQTEQGLLSLLKTIDQKNVAEQTNAFAEKVLNLTTKLDAAAVAPENGADTLEKPIPLLISDIFENILKPTDQKAKIECAMLAAEATTHYTEADIRLVQSRLSLFETLPRELMTTLFPNQQVPAGKDVIYQLARGVLATSPNAFLLANPDPEDIIRGAREKGIDELKSAEKELNKKKYTLSQEIEGLAKNTRESADDDQIAHNVQIVKRAQQNVRDIQDKMQGIGTRVTQLDLALVRQDVASARGNGRAIDADRILIRVKEQYGTTLEMLDPTLAEEAKKAEKTVALTPFEQVLKGEKKGRAVDTAVEEARESAAAADIVDQVRASTVVRFSQIANGDTYFNKRTIRDASGQDKSEFFKKYSYVDVINASGKKVSVALTPEAKQRIETLPRGTKPVILKAVTPLSFQRTGGGRRGVMSYKYTGSDFGASILDAKDIGTVNDTGDVFDGAGKPVDMNTDPRAEVAREQIGMQRAFTVSDYVPKPAAQLRKMDGKPYDKRLITIKTASGRTYEGMTVATDAWVTLNKPAPDGMTLVLKREPRNIALRTPETERTGRRSSRAIRRVNDVDMISASDLAYAKLNGDELTTANVNDPTKTETGSASDLVRKREEDSRDILRAIDQSEPIKQTTHAASAIGESMAHLQKIMSAGNEGTKRQAMVDFARAEAEPMLKLLRDPNTSVNVNQALSQLRALKEANLGVALGGAEREINARIQSLEQFAELLQSGRVADIFETIMDKSKFDADTWSRWFSTEFPKILAAIAVATAIIVTVIFTCGGAAPLWAVSATTFNVLIAAGGAAGGIIGMEAGAEGVRKGRQLLDKDVRSGRLAYSNRSRLCAYLEGQEVLDPTTGKKIPMEFIKDVASPYTQEFAFSFVTTYAALGLGTVVASRLSALAQNSTWVQGLATRSPTANRIMSYLSQVSDDAARVGAEKSSLIKTWLHETVDELQDEFVKEKGVEAVLAQVDERLGPCAAFLLTVARGFKPTKVSQSSGAFLGDFTAEGTSGIAQAEAAVKAQGYPSVTNAGDYLIVTDHEGHTFNVRPETDSVETKAEAGPREVKIPTTEATSADINQMTENGKITLIGARNRTGASPEVTQEAATNLVSDRVALAKSVANPATRTEAVTRYNQLLKAQGGKELSEAEVIANCAKFEQVVAAIENGSIGLEGTYIGSSIRDLNKLMPGIEMEAKQSLCRRLHTSSMDNENEARITRGEKPFANMDQYMEWLLSPDQTIEGGRPVTPNGEFDAKDAVHLGTNPEVSTRLAPVVDAMSALANDSNATFTRAQVEQVLAENPQLDSVDRTILLETATLLENIKAKAGDASLPDAERWKILEFSARYVQDFRASPDFKATPQQLLNLVADNAINLSHQNIMDHMTLVGSSHGTLHVLRGNSEMLNSLYGQMGFTPAMRVLAMQATFDHDMGYTKRTLVGKTPKDGVFESSKDHPLESTLRVESKREAYEQIFGGDGYITIRNAVLDHSDAMGNGQYADYATKLDIIADQNAPAAERVAAAVALVDCLATVSNLKASPLFKNNPEIMATMARIEQIHREINALSKPSKDAAEAAAKAEGLNEKQIEKSGEDAVKTFQKQSPEVKALRDEAKSMRIAMQDRIAQMKDIPKETRQAYLTSLESTMQWEGSDFAITSNLGMLAASVSSELQIDAEGKVHAAYTVDINGLATIARALDPKAAAKAATSGIIKAADDFGKLTPESTEALNMFVMHAGNVESTDSVKRAAAEAYFAENEGHISLPTNSRLVIEVNIGKNSEYESTRVAVETGLRIDAIRGLARANIKKLVSGEPITIEGVDGNQVELLDVNALQTYAESTVSQYIGSLPANYVMQNAAGEYVPVLQAFNEAKAAARSFPVTWKEFGDRMFRTAGSNAPLQRKAA